MSRRVDQYFVPTYMPYKNEKPGFYFKFSLTLTTFEPAPNTDASVVTVIPKPFLVQLTGSRTYHIHIYIYLLWTRVSTRQVDAERCQRCTDRPRQVLLRQRPG